jgi:hypothetical protein
MMILGALASLQEVAIKTPDTSGYMRAGYLAIGAILIAYLIFLWGRARKAR